MAYKISEISKLTQLSTHTLHYYEDIGLLKPQYNAEHQREYCEADVDWLKFIELARGAGMTIATLQTYSELCVQGDSTIIDRIALIAEQEQILLSKRAELDKHIDFLQQKKRVYYKQLKNVDSKD